jgi:hypothetical protein
MPVPTTNRGLAPAMLPRTSGPTVIALTIFFRSQGIQWPLRNEDVIYVRHARTRELLFVTTGELLMTLLRHRMDEVALQTLVRLEMEHRDPAALGVDIGPTTYLQDKDDQPPTTRDQRQTLRDQRRRRKPLRKMPKKMLFPLGAACALANAHHLPDFNELFWTLYAVLEVWL